MTVDPMFESLVIKHFSDVAARFKLAINKRRGDEFNLYNEKVIVRLIYDMGHFHCDFTDPEEKRQRESIKRQDGLPSGYPSYFAFSLWEFFYPNDPIDYNYREWDLEGQIIADKKLLLERLTNVLYGDFSWLPAYKQKDSRIARKIEHMMNNLAVYKPVMDKFKEGDPSWEAAFDEYKKIFDKL